MALALAQALLEAPRMFNHSRGLWGYTGTADDGLPLSVQSTGIGGPSAAIVLEELAGLGLGRAIRVGTCGVIGPASRLELGDLLIVEAAVAADGTSRALGAAGDLAPADGELLAAMIAAAPATARGVVVSRDVFYGPRDDLTALVGEAEMIGGQAAAPHARAGAIAVDLETAALFTLGRLRSVAVACVVVVTDLLAGDRRVRIDDESLDEACERAGRLAAAGLAACRNPSTAPGPTANRTGSTPGGAKRSG
ncbi:MAG: purine-nucleoside phosphorylase [Solirubrobacteraceae bacterium]|nr:purine-nucleoside phosphorylase [Solirubrobacteraceae bacterium]